MNNYDDGSVLGFSSRGFTSERRGEFIVPFLTAIIVLALGLLVVTVTCRAAPQDSPALETIAAQNS